MKNKEYISESENISVCANLISIYSRRLFDLVITSNWEGKNKQEKELQEKLEQFNEKVTSLAEEVVNFMDSIDALDDKDVDYIDAAFNLNDTK